MKVLVCGGRNYNDREMFNSAMWLEHEERPITLIIQGGAGGADRLAREWAKGNGIDCDTYEADWGKHGRAAGPMRNNEMLKKGKPDLVMAFPGGRGTSDMTGRAIKANTDVIRINH